MVHRGIPYNVHYRKVKYPRLEFRSGCLELILPPRARPEEVLDKHWNWILKKQQFIQDCLNACSRKPVIHRSEEDFRMLAFSTAQALSRKLHIPLPRLYFRTMRTKWASCSSKHNITLNSLMRFLPKPLVEYILYHEFAHLRERYHNKRFWSLIAERYPNHRTHERSLFAYWFLLHQGGSLNPRKRIVRVRP